MRFFIGALILLLTTLPGVAQDSTGGFTATASRTITVPPTEAVISITVSTAINKTLDDVLAKVKELDLTIDNLVNISAGSPTPLPVIGAPVFEPRTTYGFLQTVALDQIGATIRKVNIFTASNSDYIASANQTSIRATPAAIMAAYQKAFPEVYREAKARAEDLARQVGLTPGKVLSVIDSIQTLAFATLPYSSGSVQYPLSVTVRIAIN